MTLPRPAWRPAGTAPLAARDLKLADFFHPPSFLLLWEFLVRGRAAAGALLPVVPSGCAVPEPGKGRPRAAQSRPLHCACAEPGGAPRPGARRRGRVPGARGALPAVVGCVLDALAPAGEQLPLSTPAVRRRPRRLGGLTHTLRPIPYSGLVMAGARPPLCASATSSGGAQLQCSLSYILRNLRTSSAKCRAGCAAALGPPGRMRGRPAAGGRARPRG